MIHKWCSSLSNRTIIVTLVVCVLMLYISYTFNPCLVAKLQGSLRLSRSKVRLLMPDMNADSISDAAAPHEPIDTNQIVDLSPIKMFGSLVRIVPLTDPQTRRAGQVNRSRLPANNSDATPKYRLLRQQALQPNRHLPGTLIIGVKKSGTRALLEFVRLHPDVRAAGCEVHFFDRHYAKGLHWYRSHMPATIDGQMTMEKTPSYFVTREVPQRVHHMNPGTKLLVVVRDPVTRAISDYTQAASKKEGMKRFEELAFFNESTVDTTWGPVKIGVYARHLERWLQYFPLSQLLFISGERLIVDPALEMGRVQDFLGLKRVVTEKHFYFNSTKGFPCLFKSEAKSSPHCLGKTKGRNHPYIDPAAIDRLRDFYRPFNERFYKMTGIHFGWL